MIRGCAEEALNIRLLAPLSSPRHRIARRFTLRLAGDHRAMSFVGKSLCVSSHIRAYALAYEMIFRERDRRDDVRNDDLLPNCISPHVRIAFGVLSRAVNYTRAVTVIFSLFRERNMRMYSN